MKKAFAVTAVLAAAVIVFALFTLPPRPEPTAPAAIDAGLLKRTVSGAFHVHTTRSDGAGDRRAVAAAARAAGLQFVIFTDHGDGTRAPEPPAYLDGVLCLDGVEISTILGHYLALGLEAAAPYPLGGESDAVVEDVARLGGFGFAAHPDSPRLELSWRDRSAPIDGLEWLNADSEWRDEASLRLGRIFFDYALRPSAAMASILDRPEATLARWDALTATRPVVAIAGHDAHGGIGRRLENGSQWALGGIPSYDASFRSFAVRAVLSSAPAGDAAADGRALIEAIRGGRVFTAIDAVAAPAALDFRASREGEEAFIGGLLPPGGPAHFIARAPVPPDARIVLLRNGEDVQSSDGGSLDFSTTHAEGAYRVEVRTAGAPGDRPVPWLLSNPIYFVPAPVPRREPSAPVARSTVARTGEWRIEKDPGSRAVLETADAHPPRVAFTLHEEAGGSPFVALATDLSRPGGAFSRIEFNAAATRPMRISVQLRYPDSQGMRWVRSVYVDSTDRRLAVDVTALRPADGQTGAPPDTELAGSLLFVVDLTNATPGFTAGFHIGSVSLVR